MLENTEMTGGQKQLVQLRLASPLPLVPGERFVVRANVAGTGVTGLTTIGGGQILGISNMRLRRQEAWTLDLLAARRDAVADPAALVRTDGARKRAARHTVAGAAREHAGPPGGNRAPSGIPARRGPGASRRPDGGWIHREIMHEQRPRTTPPAIRLFTPPTRNAPGISREELLAHAEVQSPIFSCAGGSLLHSKQLERQRRLLARAGWKRAAAGTRPAPAAIRIAAKLRLAGSAPPGLRMNWPWHAARAVPRVAAMAGSWPSAAKSCG